MSHTSDEERQIAKEMEGELTAEEIRNHDRIMALRRSLWEHLKQTRHALDMAVDDLNKLADPTVWDAEYEGGSPFRTHLLETGRLLDITRGLMPTDAEGEMVTNDHMKAIHALMLGNRK